MAITPRSKGLGNIGAIVDRQGRASPAMKAPVKPVVKAAPRPAPKPVARVAPKPVPKMAPVPKPSPFAKKPDTRAPGGGGMDFNGNPIGGGMGAQMNIARPGQGNLARNTGPGNGGPQLIGGPADRPIFGGPPNDMLPAGYQYNGPPPDDYGVSLGVLTPEEALRDSQYMPPPINSYMDPNQLVPYTPGQNTGMFAPGGYEPEYGDSNMYFDENGNLQGHSTYARDQEALRAGRAASQGQPGGPFGQLNQQLGNTFVDMFTRRLPEMYGGQQGPSTMESPRGPDGRYLYENMLGVGGMFGGQQSLQQGQQGGQPFDINQMFNPNSGPKYSMPNAMDYPAMQGPGGGGFMGGGTGSMFGGGGFAGK